MYENSLISFHFEHHCVIQYGATLYIGTEGHDIMSLAGFEDIRNGVHLRPDWMTGQFLTYSWIVRNTYVKNQIMMSSSVDNVL